MIQVTDEMITNAQHLMAKGDYNAAGYRLIVKTIGAISGLEQAEKDKYSALAAAGFETKTAEQKEKEDKGTFYGIVVSVGKGAFKAAALGGESWTDEGDVVMFDRYAGVVMEIPPGSEQTYRFMNDESLIGIVKENK